MKPLIGLTPSPEVREQEHGTFRLHTLNENYSQAIIAAGGLPVMLPSNNDDIEQLLDHLHGVVLTGGGDIDPSMYGQEPHEKLGGVDEERDRFEQAIIHAAIVRDLPLLGICRGLQMLNVALGGSLYQDIDDMVEGAGEHRQQSRNIHHESTFQTATVANDDHPLHKMTAEDRIDINTFHHQAIHELAKSLQVIAQSDDGVVEAVYKPELTFCLAVQWHPEMLHETHEVHAAIFRSLVEASRDYRSRISNREVPELV